MIVEIYDMVEISPDHRQYGGCSVRVTKVKQEVIEGIVFLRNGKCEKIELKHSEYTKDEEETRHWKELKEDYIE